MTSTTNEKPKICIITTLPSSLDALFPGFYTLLVERGYDVYAVSAPGQRQDKVRQQGAKTLQVPMSRTFTVMQDIKALWQLYRLFKKEKFDIIHYSTPKASFLSAIAGGAAGDAYLLYTLRGLGYTAFTGIKRSIGKYCEKCACKNADKIIAISPSLKEESVRERLADAEKFEVLGSGSSKGVNVKLFTNSQAIQQQREQIRENYNIAPSDIVIGYAGRLTPEKGINELLAAFKKIEDTFNNVHLMLIGEQDTRNPLKESVHEKLASDKKIHLVGRVLHDFMPSHFAAMDIMALPSYREGFGNIVIEASAMEVAVVASDIPGCRDALVDGHTGFYVKAQNTESLFNALTKLVKNPQMRRDFGRNGREFVCQNFDREVVWDNLLKVYDSILTAHG